MNPPSARSPVGSRSLFQRLALAIAYLTCVLNAGCFTFTRGADHDVYIERERIIGRRYILMQDGSFKIPKDFVFPIGIGRPDWTSGTISLHRGAVLRVQRVRFTSADGIDGGMFREYQFQAIVLTQPNVGARIALRGLENCESFEPDAPSRSEEERSDIGEPCLAPLPDEVPAWLDTTRLPPVVTSVSTTELSAAAHNKSWATRFYAVRELGRRAPLDARATHALCDAVNDDLEDIRREALVAFSRLRPVPTEALMPLFINLRNERNDYSEHRLAMSALREMGPAAYPALGRKLHSPNNTEVIDAAILLANAKPGAAIAQVPDLEQALPHDPWSKGSPLWSVIIPALAAADPSAALQAIAPELDTPNVDQFRWATALLASVAVAASGQSNGKEINDRVVTELTKHLDDREIAYRSAAVSALGSIGPRARAALPALRRLEISTPRDATDVAFNGDLEDTVAIIEGSKAPKIADPLSTPDHFLR